MEPTKLQVNRSTAVMKVISAQCLPALYDNLRGHPELISNGFKEVGIVAVLVDQTNQLSDEDPFADLDYRG